ncbi:MAG: hypothetical protein LCH67_07200 [Bacteroidetes bacterium]|nr:hypothetical protein [Bacteroidota bacterium]
MKKAILMAVLVLTAKATTLGQTHFYGQDALKYYSYNNLGSARAQGMGGAFTALGGDISNAAVNPAGLAFFNKNEFSITPIFISNQTTSSYIGNNITRNSSNLGLGQIGVVFSNKGVGSRKKRSAWGINYQTLANFNNDYSYEGSNQKSSIADYFAEKAYMNGASVQNLRDDFDENTLMAKTDISMAYWAYMIDPFEDGYIANELSVPVVQKGNVTESGSLGQVNLSYGINYDDKTYLGASLGFQNLNYSLLTDINESFPEGTFFKDYTVGDELYVSGNGVNLSLGGIFKLTNSVKIGANVVSPTAIRVKETYNSWVNFRQYPDAFQEDYNYLSTIPNDFSYKITSPLKTNLGVSVVLPKKVGVISVEAEYLGYSMMNIKDKNEAKWSSDQKRGIQDEFKDVLNLKAGGEVRFGIGRIRAGLNYLSDPHRNPSQYNSKNILIGTFGVGVRNSKLFADLAYSQIKTLSAFTPYTLENPENYSSVGLDQKKGILAISIGTFF